MIAKRSTRRSEKTTPAFARAGVPIMLWSAIPIRMAMIIGLKVATPGIARRATAARRDRRCQQQAGRNRGVQMGGWLARCDKGGGDRRQGIDGGHGKFLYSLRKKYRLPTNQSN